MAREGYRSMYGDLGKLKDRSLLDNPAQSTAFDDEMWELLSACSELVDNYLNRNVYPLTATYTFDGSGILTLLVPDLISVTTLKADEDQDLTYEVTWAATDFQLYPLNAQPTQPWGRGYNQLLARSQGNHAEGFKAIPNGYEIVGIWGYRNYSEASGSLINEVYDATDTTLTVDAGTDFQIGQTILIESEQLLVTGISTNDLTVVRAINGTTGASHADDTTISIMRWPVAVERGTLLTAARIWHRAPGFERSQQGLDLDVQLLLHPYRRLII